MNSEELNKKIKQDFKKGNFRENFNDLIKIYKSKKDNDNRFYLRYKNRL